ncbi:hypothetical protein PENTCL1PPCAC_30614, partial [Pristionchus entomophagus]
NIVYVRGIMRKLVNPKFFWPPVHRSCQVRLHQSPLLPNLRLPRSSPRQKTRGQALLNRSVRSTHCPILATRSSLLLTSIESSTGLERETSTSPSLSSNCSGSPVSSLSIRRPSSGLAKTESRSRLAADAQKTGCSSCSSCCKRGGSSSSISPLKLLARQSRWPLPSPSHPRVHSEYDNPLSL